MAKSDIAALRAQVARSQRLANSKINRIRATGAEVKGTRFDPTRDPAKVAKYNTRQLRAYQAELDAFRDRKVQFVAGAKGAPIPRAQWNRYSNLQAAYNKVSGREFTQVESVKLPGGQSIGERELTFLPEGRSAGGRASNRPRGGVNIKASQVVSADAIPKLEERLRSRMTDTYYKRTLQRQRMELSAMLDKAGMSDLAENAAALSDKQFNTLWNYTDFPEFMSAKYESVKNMSVEDEVKTSDDHRQEVASTLAWARRIK